MAHIGDEIGAHPLVLPERGDIAHDDQDAALPAGGGERLQVEGACDRHRQADLDAVLAAFRQHGVHGAERIRVAQAVAEVPPEGRVAQHRACRRVDARDDPPGVQQQHRIGQGVENVCGEIVHGALKCMKYMTFRCEDTPAMRDFHLPGRSPARAANAMVATSQPSATLAGVEVLRSGGNAVDAAVAACAVMCVTEPQSTGIGGDCFCLYTPAGAEEPIALNGSGHAPAGLSAEWLADRGMNTLDGSSPHAVTVPGAVDAWEQLLQDHGSKGLDELLQPAIRYAEDGFVVHARTASDWSDAAGRLAGDADTAARFLPEGKAVGEGRMFHQPELANTLRRIAGEGRSAFYEGEVAADMVGKLRAVGGLHTEEDFAARKAEYVEPISTDYRGYTVFECPPNGVGVIALLILNMLEGFEPAEDPLSPERMHRLIEATRLAYRDRNAFVADPADAEVPLDMLLSKDYAAALGGTICEDRAAAALPPAGWPAHEDTVYLSVVDRDGNACSFINSLYKSFGSAILAPGSGVMLHNRGLGFSLEPGHPNAVRPNRRPMHTIIPAMLAKDGQAVMPFGVMGGHYQPVGQSWVLSSILDHGLDPQAALDLPRLFAYEDRVAVERGIPEAACAELRRRGHPLTPADPPHGGGQAIWIDRESGTLVAGSDPRKDGLALGY